MVRLYANENFPLPAVTELRRLGHEVLTVRESGGAGHRLSDVAVLEYAIQQGMAVITLNRRHFVRLHLERPTHLGIVVCTFDPDFTAQSARIDDAIRSAGPLTGLLLRVNRPA